MLKKLCELADFKLSNEGSGSFSGYGSTFGNFDRAKEAVVKGAFENTLEQFKSDGFIAVGHEWSGLPVATISEAHEDEKGLFIKGDFHSTPEAQAARTVVKERLDRGKSVGLSIGYEVKDKEKSDKGLLLKELELYEVSIVTVPCNPLATATEAKSAEFKAQYLGEYAEASTSISAIRSLNDSLCWNVLYDCLYDTTLSDEDRLTRLRGAFDEFRDISLRVVEALLSVTTEEREAEAKSIRVLWDNPAHTKDLDAFLLTEKTLEQDHSYALTAVEVLKGRLSAIKAIRTKQGRVLSQTNRDRLSTLMESLDATRADLEALLAETDSPSTDDETGKASDAAQAALLRFQQTRARILGVPV